MGGAPSEQLNIRIRVGDYMAYLIGTGSVCFFLSSVVDYPSSPGLWWLR